MKSSDPLAVCFLSLFRRENPAENITYCFGHAARFSLPLRRIKSSSEESYVNYYTVKPPSVARPRSHADRATYGITFVYKRYSSDFDGSGKSVPLIESCHLWECHLWRFHCNCKKLIISLFNLFRKR